jgi:hypothetical protein
MADIPVNKVLGQVTKMIVDENGVSFEIEITDPEAYKAMRDGQGRPVRYVVEDDDEDDKDG